MRPFVDFDGIASAPEVGTYLGELAPWLSTQGWIAAPVLATKATGA